MGIVEAYCPKCHLTKQFYTNAKRESGRASWCIDCSRQFRREYLKTDRGRKNHIEGDRKFRESKGEKRLLWQRQNDAKRYKLDIEGKTLHCYRCGCEGGLEVFWPSMLATYKKVAICGNCWNEESAKRTTKAEQSYDRRSAFSMATTLYTVQCVSSKERNHPPPSYTREEFIERLVSDPLYLELHKKYVDSGFNRKIKPSIDRINPLKPYTLDNIQILTVSENSAKGRIDQQKIYRVMKNLYITDEKVRKSLDAVFEGGQN